MIITNEIERLENKGIIGELTTTKIKMLRHLRKKHPELDYADELLEMVRELQHMGCVGEIHSTSCEKAQDLLSKIDVK